jgi:hypothetical protein
MANWIEAKIGTRNWCVAVRRSARVARYDVVFTPAKFAALRAEYTAETGLEY